MNEGGRIKKIPSDRAVLLQLRQQALKGNLGAIRLWVHLAAMHTPEQISESLGQLSAEDEQLLAELGLGKSLPDTDKGGGGDGAF